MRALALSSQGPFRTSDLGILDLSGTLLSLLPSWTSDLGILDFESALRTRRDKSDFGLGIWDFISSSHQIGSRQSQGNLPPPTHPSLSCVRTRIPGLGLPFLCFCALRVRLELDSRIPDFRTRTKLLVARLLHGCDRDCWRPTRCAYAEWFMPRAIVSPHLPTRTRPSCCGSFKVCFDIVRFSLSKRYRRPMAHPSHYIISPLTPHARPSSCARQRAMLMA